jgi:hypothetical protein
MLPPEPTPAGSLRDILGLSNDLHHSESVASALPPGAVDCMAQARFEP